MRYISNFCFTKSIFYVHDLTYSGLLLINNLPNFIELDEDKTLVARGEIYALCIKSDGKEFLFKCLHKILPIPLAELAANFKYEKKCNVNYSNIDKTNFKESSIEDKTIKECEWGLNTTTKILTALAFELKSHLIDWNSCHSISSLALKIFKSKFNNFNLPLQQHANVEEKLRLSYYGGRCEVFGNPDSGEYLYYYDFTGMYMQMLKQKFPLGESSFIANPSQINIGFYYITVRSQIHDIPILPYRDLITNKLLFPNGIFSGIYWYEEIELFRKHGGEILAIHWGYEYEQEDYALKEFAAACAEQRKKSLVGNLFWKLIPNSLIGRFGLKRYEEVTRIVDESDYNPTNFKGIYKECVNIISDKRINKKVVVRYSIKNISKDVIIDNNVCLAAITTAKARILWWETAQSLRPFGGRVLYCDTDSLYVAYKHDVDNEKHGLITWDTSIKKTKIIRACFASTKEYSVCDQLENVTKIKGASRSFDDFELFQKKFYEGNYVDIKTSFFSKKSFNISILQVTKKFNLQAYDKRLFSKDKKYTTPLVIYVPLK